MRLPNIVTSLFSRKSGVRSAVSAVAIAFIAASSFLFLSPELQAADKKTNAPAAPSKPKEPPKTARSAAQLESVLAKDPGYVEFVHVEIGSAVAKGDLIVSLDTDRFRHSYETTRIRAESKGQIATASAELRSKQSQYDTVKDGVRFRRADESQLAKASAELDIAKAKLQLAVEADKLSELEFKRASEQLNARFIRSPINGVLVEVPRKRGDNVTPGMIIARVSDPSKVGASFQLTPEAAAEFESGGKIAVRKVGSDSVEYARIQSIFAIPGDANGLQQMNLLFDNPQNAHSAEYELVPETPESGKIPDKISPSS